MMNMKYKQLSLLAAVSILAVMVLAGCSSTPAPTTQPTAAPTAAPVDSATTAAATDTAVATASTGALKTFTAAELAKYDGQNGNPAYIAIDGKVYDVTNVPEWKNGSHAGGRFQAGKDYSAEMAQAPHGKDKLNGVPVVGTYVK